ncbi:hypothetical protein [Fluviicola taffensis]|uniref:Uncharacterized protein n=1 Tax=Fluviicola taffensis (strain DSM 16823 / NCIMB 13979 / RW262) TaxID=755732 RepID=F2I9I9_FLUTR|nr:hypothetical protein [Fluviicola taffensis]AEA45170.1 hypothetical protein Fluta_3196 [Fluviicola taffensis DSM 16823]
MKITINDQQTIAEIQNSFNKEFPFLKLEFFSKRHLSGHPSPIKFLIRKNLLIRECRTIHHEGEITISPDMKVNELEQKLWNQYGLGVQVFRKSGMSWLETILTDNWTLAEQNAEGESLSKGIPPDELDYYQDRN